MRLTRLLDGRVSTAAGLLTAGWMLLVAVPLVWMGFNLADHIRDATELVRTSGGRPAAASGMVGRAAPGG